ncbi:uncharacterized protein LOC143354315 [Halictus rubicundus]|uniref:uncharacterized protein LOC143354315 n=1 Tax=Halictus rubicundus TaxID=77578 RepID=UPI004036D1C4
MDSYICNKCYATANRGKQPFCLTQCGHIYCQECIQPAEKLCPQCQNVDSFSVELQQPSLSRVQNFFTPIKEGLESLSIIFGFQDNQMKIVTRRFLELDKYNKTKMEIIELRKKLKYMEIHNRTMNSESDTSTPIISTNRKCKPRHTASTYGSISGTNLSSTCKMFDGFRIPNSQSAKSHNSRDTSDTNSMYTFRR